MADTIHRAGFGGGIVRAGSPDQAKDDELELCDSMDIGARGELVPTANFSDYTNVKDKQGAPAVLSSVLGLGHVEYTDAIRALLVGQGIDAGAAAKYYLGHFDPATEGAIVGAGNVLQMSAIVPSDNKALATFAAFPYVGFTFGTGFEQWNPIFVNLGSRSGSMLLSPGLYVLLRIGGVFFFNPIGDYDSLGTGTRSELITPGTKGKQLYFRGIFAYNNHIFGYGYDSRLATGEAPNRLMFCNIGKPFMWGNDNLAVGVDRDFTDSDAFNIGEGGEIITCGIAHKKRAWIGTNRGLHYVEGYGRASFLTDGAIGIQKSLDVVGVHAMIEGADGALYGVSRQGLWRMGDDGIEHLYRKLVDYAGRSIGYWDCMWEDSTRAVGIPGKTNTDLVWLLSVPNLRQVWVVIPWCNIGTGFGYGTSTTILKYHIDTGGFSRQWYPVPLMHGAAIPQTTRSPDRMLVGAGNSSNPTVFHFGKRTGDATTSPSLATACVLKTIEHAQFGADGVGVYRKAYLTVAWEAGAEPVAFAIAMYVDGELADTVYLYICNSATTIINLNRLNNGDLVLDLAGTDTNLGNATAGALIEAQADYILKQKVTGGFRNLPFGGQKGRRATIPIAFKPRRGNRVSVKVTAQIAVPTGAAPTLTTLDPTGRYSIEGLGTKPGYLSGAA